ncbi:Crp/Fnr family transcriptional regulator [Polaromonas sp.]|uniref:Crp/Fnr family transcriptional regulator n=1 Tax=Polaromonas sp. TaxID=1869339 RepID=UPI001798CA4C|nr:Crp/Fnr family transcriptional regulator [Polaromonas sp.]NMM05030.1 Crp/Fnr family transcriptional regulator [Polaromonas sp.]
MKKTLADSWLFRMLDDEQLDQMVSHTCVLPVSQNMCVVKQGDAPEGTYWIVSGQVKIVLQSKKGGEKTLEILGPNTCFGLGEMLLNRPHLAFAKTTTDSLILHIDRDAMLQAAKMNFGFARELMTCVGRQFYGLVRDIKSYSQTAKQRLAGYLLRQSLREASDDIELVANKSLIASRLSLTPETLSRLFHDLAQEGMISISGRQIRILDIEKMSLIA